MKKAEGIAITPPHGRELLLQHLVLDLNGTLALDGRLIAGVEEHLARLVSVLDVHVLTANTFGTAENLKEIKGLHVRTISREAEGGPVKAQFVRSLGREHSAAMGNGMNDVAMLETAALGIAVLGPEGCAAPALMAAHIVVKDPVDGLSLLLNPLRLAATLRR